MTNYMGLVATMTGRFGDGTEKDYELWKNSISESNEIFYKKAKENLKNHIVADDFMVYLALVGEVLSVPDPEDPFPPLSACSDNAPKNNCFRPYTPR
jgi:hypothetical protein